MTRFSRTVRFGNTPRPSGIVHRTNARQRFARRAVDVPTTEMDATATRLHLAARDLERRALARRRSVRATRRRCRRETQVDAVQHLDLSVRRGDVAELEHGARGSTPPERRRDCGRATRWRARASLCALSRPSPEYTSSDCLVPPDLGRRTHRDERAVVDDVDRGAHSITSPTSCSTSSTAIPSAVSARNSSAKPSSRAR